MLEKYQNNNNLQIKDDNFNRTKKLYFVVTLKKLKFRFPSNVIPNRKR